VAERMYKFLESFYKKFPQFLSVPLFLTGESYAGHYVPAVAANLVRKQSASVGVLHGMSIGNALVDPVRQFSTKPDMAFTGGAGGSLQAGVVNRSVYQQMVRDLATCEKDIERCQHGPQANNCLGAMMDCAISQTMPIQATGRNPYDLRKWGAYNNTKQTDFMNDPVVKEKFGARTWRPWAACNSTAMLPFVFSGDYLSSSRRDVAQVLNAGIHILVYAGDTDAMVDWLGCRRWVANFPWVHQREWLAAPRETVYLNGRAKGVRQSASGLTFLQIFDAGHMVPMDQPEFALAMLQGFMHQALAQTQPASSDLSALLGEHGSATIVAALSAAFLLAFSVACARSAWRAPRREQRAVYFLMA